MESPAPSARRRFRISLLSLLLLTALIATVLTTALLWREVGPLRAEVSRLRVETGQLTIADATKAYAVAIDTMEEDTWKWRVYLPQGHKYRLATKIGRITGRTSAIPRREWLEENGISCATSIEPGEYTITVQLQNDPSHPNGQDHWNVRTDTRQQRGQNVITGGGGCSTVVAWLADRRGRSVASDIPRDHRQLETDPSEGIEQMTFRPGTITETPTGWSSTGPDFTADGEGIGVWIVAE